MPDKLKKGWKTWSFDQMATMVNERVDNPEDAGVEYYVGLEHLDPESLTIRRWGSPSDVAATKLRFRKGDIIFGRRRVYQRKLAVAQFDGICSAHAMVLRAKPDVALPEFLPFFMQSDLFMERAKQISVGSLSPTINWKTLAQEEFTLPPLDEQKRIAEVLGAFYDFYEALNSLLADSWGLVRSFAQSNIARLSLNKSTIKSLSQIATIFTGRTPSSSEQGCWGNNVPFATPGDMNFIEPRLKTCQRGLTEYGVKHSVIVPAGTVLVVCIGSTIGKVARCEVPMTFNQQINGVVPKDINSVYLFMCLIECGRQLDANRATTAVPIVNKSSFSKIHIPVPSEDIQLRIADIFSQLLLAKDKIEIRLSSLQNEKKKFLDIFLGAN